MSQLTSSAVHPAAQPRHREVARRDTHLARGLVLDLLDELTVRGPSPEFWTRYWRLARFLRPEEQDFVRRAAGSPRVPGRPAPLNSCQNASRVPT